jgi:hypothetical protein
MFNPNDTRLKYDTSSYQEQLVRSIYPGAYQLNTPYNDCKDCDEYVPNDPFIRYQNYGHNTCSMKKAVDDSSELYGLNYKNSKCNNDAYKPNSYISTGCVPKVINNINDIRSCSTPTESCRLSNPPCTLKETGINRFDPLCWNPQEKAIESFDRIGVNYRMVSKDNHVPLIEKPDQQEKFIPNIKVDDDYSKELNRWAEIHQNNMNYSPGYPFNNPNYVLSCNRNLSAPCY